jgi:uncharacterized membrane protein YcaP (DUF421 family)
MAFSRSELAPRGFDWHRIWIGDESPLFLLEIAFRTTVIFGWTLLLLRLLGKRGVAQLSLFEVTIIIGLGSAVGDPMIHDDVPLVHAMVAITVIIGLYRLFMALVRRNEPFHRFVEGNATRLVSKGRIVREALARERLACDDLFEVLRIAGVRHLGEVEGAYLERSGEISVFRFAPRAVVRGLALVPPPGVDGDGDDGDDGGTPGCRRACCACGLVVAAADAGAGRRCASCQAQRWGHTLSGTQE